MRPDSRIQIAVFVLVICMLVGSQAVIAIWPTDPSVNLPIATNFRYHQAPQIARDGAGGAVVVWVDLRLTPDSLCCEGGIYGQRVGALGKLLWTVDGVPVGGVGGWFLPLNPQVVSDGDFGAIVAWEDYRSLSWDVYVQRVDPSGERLWVETDVPMCTAENDQTETQITSDGAGGAIVAWRDFRSDPLGDIYAQRVDTEGNVLWGSEGVAVCTAGREQQDVQLVSDGTGGAIVVWVDIRDKFTTAWDIYAQRVDADGVPTWTTNGLRICTEGFRQLQPKIVSDDQGGAIIAWTDERPGAPADIYAQRVDADGETLWAANGVGVCTKVYSQHRPSMASDGFSGAIVVWIQGGSLYANRVDAMGNVLWGGDAVLITAGTGVSTPQITTDGEGGAIIIWPDARNDTSNPVPFIRDVFAQRVNANGTTLWVDNGVPISTAEDDQFAPQLVADDRGGAIVTWEDWRNGGGSAYRYGIYAQRVGPDGELTTPSIPASIDIRPGSCPNPLHVFHEPANAMTLKGGIVPVAVLGSETIDVGEIDLGSLRLEGATVVRTQFHDVGTPSNPCDCDANGGHDGIEDLVVHFRRAEVTIPAVAPGASVQLTLTGLLNDGTPFSGTDCVTIVGGSGAGPGRVVLQPPIPNPFNPVTRIRYTLPYEDLVVLSIYDVGGRLVETLVDRVQPAGEHEVLWDATAVSTGIYFCRLRAGDLSESRKLILIK